MNTLQRSPERMGTLLSRLVFFSGAVAYPSYATISSLSAPRSGDDGAGLRPWLLYWVGERERVTVHAD